MLLKKTNFLCKKKLQFSGAGDMDFFIYSYSEKPLPR